MQDNIMAAAYSLMAEELKKSMEKEIDWMCKALVDKLKQEANVAALKMINKITLEQRRDPCTNQIIFTVKL